MRKISTCIVVLFFLIITMNDSFSGEISQIDSIKDISINQYVESNSISDDDYIMKEFYLEIKNTSSEIIRNVFAKIDACPEGVTCSTNKISFPDIESGGIAISNEKVEVSIDKTSFSQIELELVWQFEYDLHSEHILNETIVIEVIQ